MSDDRFRAENRGEALTSLRAVQWVGGIDRLSEHVENLVLTGKGGIDGTGNTLDNILTGNRGDNTLNGDMGNDTLNGGVGNDTLIGGEGEDSFVFDSWLGRGNIDVIEDFDPVDDTLLLDSIIFSALGELGSLNPDYFVSGMNLTAVQDADDYILYDTSTGWLYYDEDGAGGLQAVHFATLEGSPVTVTAEDFAII